MTLYNACPSWNQRIAEQVCEKRLLDGRCKKTKTGCREVRRQNISEEERTRRSERMKKIRNGGENNDK